MRVRTLMLGWEFPPFISGGLGTACHGLTRAMDRLGTPVTFVLPRAPAVRFAGAGTGEYDLPADPSEAQFAHLRVHTVSSSLQPYGRYGPSRPAQSGASLRRGGGRTRLEEPAGPAQYGPNIHAEVRRFAGKVMDLVETEEFDVIHAHDWMTFPAGIALAARTGRPLIVQVHSTEFDRSGERVNQAVYDVERQGMHAATRVIAVSNYTRNIIIGRYGVPAEKVDVVYNGVDQPDGSQTAPAPAGPAKREKVVLFLGRVTMQKGPEYFLHAANRVLEKEQNVKFVVAGEGDRLYGMIELAAWLGIGHKVFFTRFLRGPDVQRAYQMADLYVMPSVSEPFGIAPLEALQNNVPVLISKQSGIAEAFHSALKVDFWDVDEMANKMLAVLRHPPLQDLLRVNGRTESFKFRWDDAAARVNEIYHEVLQVA